VARTRQRPLASGAVSVPRAVAFLALQLTLGLAVLLQLNGYTQVLGASSLLLVATYPGVSCLVLVWFGLLWFDARAGVGCAV